MLENIDSYVTEFNNTFHKNDFQSVECLCGSTKSKEITTYDRYGLYSPTSICKKCGLIYQNHRLKDRQFREFYSTDLYRKIYNNGDYIKEFKDKLDDCNRNHVYKYLKPIVSEKKYKSVLEIGCAAGQNLLGFKNDGMTVKGYDFGPDLVNLGREYGLNLQTGTIVDALDTGEKFDIVILNHVMEHFTDIETNLNLIKKLLNKKGCLYVGVPNIDNYSIEQIQNAHTYYFSPRTFSYYMEKYGYSVLALDEAEGIHMQSVLQATRKECVFNLNNEYSWMMKKIRVKKIREFFIKILDILKIRSAMKAMIHRMSVS